MPQNPTPKGINCLPDELHLIIAGQLDLYDYLCLSAQCLQLRRIYLLLFFKRIVLPADPDKLDVVRKRQQHMSSGDHRRERSRPLELWRRKLILAPLLLLQEFCISGVPFHYCKGFRTERDMTFILLTGFPKHTLPEQEVPEDLRVKFEWPWTDNDKEKWYSPENMEYLLAQFDCTDMTKLETDYRPGGKRRERLVRTLLSLQDHYLLDLAMKYGILRYDLSFLTGGNLLNHCIHYYLPRPRLLQWLLLQGETDVSKLSRRGHSNIWKALVEPVDQVSPKRRKIQDYDYFYFNNDMLLYWKRWEQKMVLRARRMMVVLAILVRYGVDINCITGRHAVIYSLFRPLSKHPRKPVRKQETAIYYRWLNVLFPRLIHLGMDINLPAHPSFKGYQHPLHWAILQIKDQVSNPDSVDAVNVAQLVEFIKRILGSGKADLEVKSDDGLTPLCAAVQAHMHSDNEFKTRLYYGTPLAEYYFTFVSGFKTQRHFGRPEYNIAFLEVIRCLVHHGADVNATYPDGQGIITRFGENISSVLNRILRRRDEGYVNVNVVHLKTMIEKRMGLEYSPRCKFPYSWRSEVKVGIEPFGTFRDGDEALLLDGKWGEWWSSP
ncbi:hypothetical protein BJ508DRAFT_379726 [Ascobolus immersus RN42]|uniref:Uncharacterized protein n=1 Tax=Ascobolus immersus RN42 TaxID=1160509 RepID=A0A3N4HVX5_ASCIM|nr:hypothetical protein BJ508DRAFT_379726 [Ascobolus immersus RN42]